MEALRARAARYDADSTFPYENYADLHGAGADPVTYVHILREIGKACAATALTFNMHSTVTTFLAALCTEE